jgi:hypothetical protein
MTDSTTPLAEAQKIFGTAMLSPSDAARVLDVTSSQLTSDAPGAADVVPYDRGTLERARANGELLVFRASAAGAPLTLMGLLERFPETVLPRLLKGVGYQLKDEWTVDQEPFASTTTPRPGWRLVHGAPISATCNLSYELQTEALERYADARGLRGRLGRRSAIEAVYDAVMLRRAHGTRLLEHAWDWSDTPTQDGGYVTVGEFGPAGLNVLGYSRAVRFGTLGVCAQY